MKRFILCFFLFFAANSYAADYYVTDDGSGSNCTSGDPCTLSTAQGLVSAGDTMYLNSADTWSGTTILSVHAGVTYIGDEWGGGTRASLNATSNGSNQSAMIHFTTDHATYETVAKGFDVDGNYYNINLIGIIAAANATGATKRIQNCVAHDTGDGDYWYGIKLAPYNGYTVDDVEILDNEVYNTSWSGITVYPYYSGSSNTVSNVLVRGNYVHDIGGDQGSHGIMLNGGNVDNVIVEFNYVKNTYDYGLEIASKTSAGLDNVVFRYNIVTQCKVGIDFWRSGGDNYDVELYGNIIFDNDGKGLQFSSSMAGATFQVLRILNNTFYSDGGNEIDISYNIAPTIFEVRNNAIYAESSYYPLYDVYGDITAHSDNIYYRSGGGNLVRSVSTYYTSGTLSGYETSAYSTNPTFKNTSNLPTAFSGTYGTDMVPNNDGLSIESGNAIDNGYNLSSTYDGSINQDGLSSPVARPCGSGWDIGAYEYNCSGGLDTTNPYTYGHDPAPNSTGVGITNDIVVHLADDGDGVDIATIELTEESNLHCCSGQSCGGGTADLTCSGTSADYTVTLSGRNYSNGQQVDITIDADDLASSPNSMTQDSYHYTCALAQTTSAIVGSGNVDMISGSGNVSVEVRP